MRFRPRNERKTETGEFFRERVRQVRIVFAGIRAVSGIQPSWDFMNRLGFFAVLAIAGLCLASCGSSSTEPAKPTSNSAARPAAPTAPPVPDDVQKAAEKALGSETEVLLYGDLAKNGSQQALAINRMKTNPQGGAPGTVITRAVIVQNDGGTWKEVLLCDEHLENPKGYLGNIPLAPVNGWRLQYEQNQEKGLQLYFTPVADPKGARALPIEVRWNAKVKRYQSLDRNFENFLGELPSLETPESQIRL
jgi:hypothetical protein